MSTTFFLNLAAGAGVFSPGRNTGGVTAHLRWHGRTVAGDMAASPREVHFPVLQTLAQKHEPSEIRRR
jgi:hypothetical protein